MANSPKVKHVKYRQKPVRDNATGQYDNPEPHRLPDVLNESDKDVHRLADVINRPSERENDKPHGLMGVVWRHR